MILTCPSCATSYFIPDGSIGAGGRTVRCKTCQHSWKAESDEPLELTLSPPSVEAAPDATPVAEDAPETLADMPAEELPKAFRARAEQARRLKKAAAHGAAWAAVASLFAMLLGGAWLFRVDLVELAPRTAAAYAAVGLMVNPTGLEFEGVSARAAPNDPGKVLVSGALRNVRDDERVAPPVRVALLDKQGAEIGHAVIRIDAAPVLPGQLQGFAAFISDPGAKGEGVDVAFVLDPVAARAAVPAPSNAKPKPRPLPTATAEQTGLRPAILPDEAPAPANMQPIDAVAVDSAAPEAVSAEHG